eukprot:COSAG04_NODE_985_length_8992_cov_18.901844_4_plen_106_part_00
MEGDALTAAAWSTCATRALAGGSWLASTISWAGSRWLLLGPRGGRLQLAGQPSATPKPEGYLYTTHGRVPALVRPPAAPPPDPQPAPPTLSPPSPSAGGGHSGSL